MSPTKRKPERVRFTLWLTKEAFEDLHRLQDETGKGAVAEVVREAVEVYRSLRQAKKAGLELYFEDSKRGGTGRIWLLPGPPPAGRP